MIAKPFILRLVLVAFFLLASCAASSAAPGQPASGTGYLEEARYLRQQHQLVVSGWAAPSQANLFTTNLVVTLGGQEIYRGRIERSERPDVVQNTARSDWLWSGFSVRISLPSSLSAPAQPVSARMRLGNGEEFDLAVAPAARLVAVPATERHPSLRARLALVAAFALPLLALFGLRGVAPGGGRISHAVMFAGSLAVSFALLVAAGWTGSSLGLLLDQRGVVDHDEVRWLGPLRPVRSDEWQVLTPLAISQASHQPAFPVVNRNLGIDGQNMLVIGMTGVPVAHISALARPATWGFFLFDLRRGLAWSWWFPLFACFGVVWLLLRRFFLLDSRLAAGLAATVAASPYSVVFSGWPAYLIFFPVTGLLAVDMACRTRSWKPACIAGVLLGLAIAGFALVLYPAWQISLAYLWLPFAAAWFWILRKRLDVGWPQLAAAGIALAVAAVLLLGWWVDAHEAVAAIRATVYPGQRSVEVGGDIDRWFLIKGLMSPITMYRDSSLMVGASDAGSVALFIVPLFAAVAWRFAAARRIDPLAAVLCAYVLVALWFMYLGFPAAVARYSLWGSTTSYRLDLSLGLAQVLLLAWLAATGTGEPKRRPAGPMAAGALGALVAMHAAFLYQLVPPAILETVPPSFIAVSVLAMGGAGYLLLRERYTAFSCVYGTWMLAAALPFNPLGLAPLALGPAPGLAALVAGPAVADQPRGAVAVIGERNWAMTLPAAGIQVVNSVFYYPQRSLWQRLDPDGQFEVLHNRYQRVLFVLGVVQAPQGFRIDAPRLDEVRVTLDPARFDFRLLGGRWVLAGAKDGDALKDNASLKATPSAPDWTLFAVQP